MEKKGKENGRKENKCMEFLQILEFEERKSGKVRSVKMESVLIFLFLFFSFFFLRIFNGNVG